jgi:hypothetical protein
MAFWKDLITDNSGVSSKRFISLIGLIVFILMIVASLFKMNTPDIFIYGDLTLILGNQGLTLLQQNKKE